MRPKVIIDDKAYQKHIAALEQEINKIVSQVSAEKDWKASELDEARKKINSRLTKELGVTLDSQTLEKLLYSTED